MIKYFLSCRGGWSKKLQIVKKHRIKEEQDKRSQLEAVVDAMTDEEIVAYKSLNEHLNEQMRAIEEEAGSRIVGE